MPLHPPTPEELEAMNNEWVEPYDEATAPKGLTYATYDAKIRGPDQKASYWVILPEGYDESPSVRYSVLFWLHGGMSRGSAGATTVGRYQAAMKTGAMPQTIIVLPQGLPVGWYINSIEGDFPIEDVLIRDLLPHVDTTYRTNSRRGIEGFSMGGYGAAHLGFRYSHLFGGVSCICPAVLPSLDLEPRERVWDTFHGNQAFYDFNHPKHLVKEHQAAIRSSGLRLRLIHDAEDTRLGEACPAFIAAVKAVGVPATQTDISGSDHKPEILLDGLKDHAFSFWKDVFE